MDGWVDGQNRLVMKLAYVFVEVKKSYFAACKLEPSRATGIIQPRSEGLQTRNHDG